MKKKPFTPIYHEFMEGLFSVKFTAPQYAVILLISRYSHGFGNSRTRITQATISNKTGYTKRTVRNVLRELAALNVVEIHEPPTGRRSALIGINGKVSDWLVERNSHSAINETIEEPSFRPTGTLEGNGHSAQRGTTIPPREEPSFRPEGNDRSISGFENPDADPDDDYAPADLKKTNKETDLKENIFKENITKKEAPLARVSSSLQKISFPEIETETDPDATHFEPEDSFWDTSNFRGKRVVDAYRLLYGREAKPSKKDIQFAGQKLNSLLPAVSGKRARRDLEGALILAARQLRHEIALGKDVQNPWGYIWTTVPDQIPAAKEFNFRISYGYNPDSPKSYVWDSEQQVLRATKRRQQFERWMTANAEENERRGKR